MLRGDLVISPSWSRGIINQPETRLASFKVEMVQPRAGSYCS